MSESCTVNEKVVILAADYEEQNDAYALLDCERLRQKDRADKAEASLALLHPAPPEPPSREPGFRDATLNKALDRIAYLTDSGTFHGYRSEVWSVMAEVWDAARRYPPSQSREMERKAFVAGWKAGQYEADNGDRIDGSLDAEAEAARRYPPSQSQEKI